ncbi:MAG: hypothetical protein U0P30_04550 [Vicinamibacterales bacterium]
MSMRTLVLSAILPATLVAAPYAALQSRPAALAVQVNVATLHAAALTTARDGADRGDQPYLLASILGPGAATSTARLPNDGHLGIQLDEAVGPRPLASLSLAPGEHARLVIAALEGPKADMALEGRVAAASTTRPDETPASLGSRLASVMAPLTARGDHWLGAALLDVANEAGTVRWRTFACLATCEVLSAPEAPKTPDAPLSGVIELTGAGGTYHLKVETRTGH